MHNFGISTKNIEVQWKTDGMGINTHRHHVGTIQKNVECEKSEFPNLPSCNLYGPEGHYPCQSFTGALWSLLAVGFELA
jgi:hypothetical protein